MSEFLANDPFDKIVMPCFILFLMCYESGAQIAAIPAQARLNDSRHLNQRTERVVGGIEVTRGFCLRVASAERCNVWTTDRLT